MRTKFLTTEATDTSTIVNLHAMVINAHSLWRAMGHTMATLFAFTGDAGLCSDSILEQILNGGWQSEVDVGILRRAEVVCCQRGQICALKIDFVNRNTLTSNTLTSRFSGNSLGPDFLLRKVNHGGRDGVESNGCC